MKVSQENDHNLNKEKVIEISFITVKCQIIIKCLQRIVEQITISIIRNKLASIFIIQFITIEYCLV